MAAIVTATDRDADAAVFTPTPVEILLTRKWIMENDRWLQAPYVFERGPDGMRDRPATRDIIRKGEQP